MSSNRDRNTEKEDFTNYLALMSEKATFSNAFNLSFGNLNKIEGSIFRIFVSKININDIDKSQKTYSMSYKTLVRLLNQGRLSPRGNNFNDIIKYIQNLVTKGFAVPVYSSDNEINGCTWGNYFDYITIYNVKGKKQDDFSDAIIKYRFSHSIYPYVIGYVNLGLGSFNAPNRILSQISSNKAKNLLIASLGRLESQQSGQITLTPENWAITLNGKRKSDSESNSLLFYRMKRIANSLNKKFSNDFKLTLTCNKKPIKSDSLKKKIVSITVSIQVFAKDIKSSARNIDKDGVFLDNVDLQKVKNKNEISNGKFEVIGENKSANKEPDKDDKKSENENKKPKKRFHKFYDPRKKSDLF